MSKSTKKTLIGIAIGIAVVGLFWLGVFVFDTIQDQQAQIEALKGQVKELNDKCVKLPPIVDGPLDKGWDIVTSTWHALTPW